MTLSFILERVERRKIIIVGRGFGQRSTMSSIHVVKSITTIGERMWWVDTSDFCLEKENKRDHEKKKKVIFFTIGNDSSTLRLSSPTLQ